MLVKRLVITLIVLLIAIPLLAIYDYWYEKNRKIDFLDPILEQVVREKVGIFERELTAGDVWRIDKLEYNCLENDELAKIADLSGLEYFKNLNHLDLGGNLVTGLAPLKRLTKLRYLDLSHNRLSDLTPLKRLVRLYDLNLSHNEIKSIKGLENIHYFHSIYLDHNQIEEISPLNVQKSHFIGKLILSHNRISDLSPLGGRAVIISLSLDNNLIEDIGPLQSYTRVTGLDLHNNNISDLSPLKNLKVNIISLDLKSSIPQEQIEELKERGTKVITSKLVY